MGTRDDGRTHARASLAVARAKGRQVGGPSIHDRPELRERITGMRASGMTMQAIADALNADGVPTARGAGTWRVSAVQTALGYKRPAKRRKALAL